MFNAKIWLKVLLLCCVLVAVAAASGPALSSSAQSTASDNAVKTYVLPDLSLKTVLIPGLLPQASGNALSVRTCKCSCGQPCTTNADCGPGGVCTAGISCCGKDPLSSPWFQNQALASHEGPAPALSVKCK